MLTSSTADIRSWARSEGLAVADRGRLAPSILAAYAAAQTPTAKAAKATPGKAAGKKGPSKTPASSPSAAATRKTTRKTPTTVTPPKNVPVATGASQAGPAQAPDPGLGPDRIDALWETIEALAARISALESAH